tara:strand:- start:260 stop:766 length:507 start_codon:yes stop_codon:yes gene_type:complete
MEISLPFEPKWSKQWIETKLKKRFFKKPYDRFMWWRSYTPKNKPLGIKASLIDRIINGDFEAGPFLLEVELVHHTINEKFKALIGNDGEVDYGKYSVETSIDRARKKRLLEDHDKDEFRKLDDLRKLFKKEFKITEEEYKKEITKGSDTLVDFYYKLEKKYGKRINRK